MASKANIGRIVSSIKPSTLLKPTSPVVKHTVLHFGNKLLDEVGVTNPFNINSKKAKEYLKNWGAKKIKGINKTTQSRVAKILEAKFDAGASIDEIAQTLSDKFDQWSEGRAYVIARTEVSSASNFGAFEGMAQAGVDQKEWLATNDSETRDTHAALDGTVIDLNEEFESPDGGTAMYPGGFGDPAEDANCRCSILPVVSDKQLRGSHRWIWKGIEAQRKPFDRKLHSAFKKGLAAQKAAVIAALRSAA